MMNNKNRTANKILSDMNFFDYLKEKVGDRKTKTGAYYNLLEKTSAGFITPFLKNHQYVLQDNQCHVTISDLAEDWHWHRATVRSFLDRLEEMGQIHRTRFAKSIVITMSFTQADNGTGSSSEDAGSPDVMTDELDAALAKWVFGDMLIIDLEEICGQYFKKRLDEFTTNEPYNEADESMSDLDSNKKKIVKEIVGRIAMAGLQREIHKSRFDSTTAFIDFFNNDLLSDWGELLEVTKLITKLILEGNLEETDASSELRKTLLTLCKPFKASLAEYQENKKALL